MYIKFRSRRRHVCRLRIKLRYANSGCRYRRENSKLIGRRSCRYHRRSDGCFARWPVNTMHNEGRAVRPGQTTALSDNYFKSKSHLSALTTCENHYRIIIRLLPRARLCSRPRSVPIWCHMSNRDTNDRSKANLLHVMTPPFSSQRRVLTIAGVRRQLIAHTRSR